MIIPQGYKFNNEKEISSEEYKVIEQFLSFYRNQNVIVADEHRQDFSVVPLEEDWAIFKINEDKWKSVDFCKRIVYKGKLYVVELNLWRDGREENEPKCLIIREFKIVTDDEVHFITLDTDDYLNRKILFNIISIFDEKKIISPEQGYSMHMYNNKALQGFIKNHEWQNINTGIQQMPKLANALFIVREGFESDSNYTADFGTILYQLISFRINNLNNFDEKDLKQLDELIFEFRKTRLLKVQLHEKGEWLKYRPTNSILLESNIIDSRVHISRQYTADNTALLDEYKTLNQCIRSLKLKDK